MTSRKRPGEQPKWPHAVALHGLIIQRMGDLDMTWSDVEEQLERQRPGCKPEITVRSIQLWAHGKSKVKFASAMAALQAVALSEAQAYERLSEIHTRFSVKLEPVAFGRGRAGRSATAFPSDEIRAAVLADPQIMRLPAVFEVGETLPIATTFVDLSLLEREPVFRPTLLETLEPPGRRIWQRETRLRRPRRPADRLLDGTEIRPSILLGGPGSGKSALMRRIAVDVAEGRWRGAAMPLFVELRRYWAAREAEPGLTLLSYAVSRQLPRLGGDPVTRDRLARTVAAGEAEGVLLLADGLDEIAGQPAAVEAVYAELDALAGAVPWIATARPTGLMRTVGAARRLELEPLSPDSVELLVQSWSAASGAPAGFAGRLYAEIAGSPALRQMAGNPFLLTAICYLRKSELDRPLPDSRSAIYQRLMAQIALQAQRRTGDARVLDAGAMDALERFCLALYEDTDAPKQIFTPHDWQRHGERSVDLATRILPARLVTSTNEVDADYHFLHLSLQEHLIARALMSAPPADVLRLRFSPAWRAVFRAYGALLNQTGDHRRFRALLRTLYEETDLLRMSHVHLAEVVADAGVRDTTPWIGADLRETLWAAYEETVNEMRALSLEALEALDAEFLEAKALVELEKLDVDLDALEEEFGQDFDGAVFPGEPYQQYGFDADNPPRLLARAGTDTAHARVLEIFHGPCQRCALAAATALADIARPSDRQRLAAAGDAAEPFSDTGYRLLAYAIASPSAELVPFLMRLADAAEEDAGALWDRTLSLLIDIGGEDVRDYLAGVLRRHIARWQSHPAADRQEGARTDAAMADRTALVILLSKLRETDAPDHAALIALAELEVEDAGARAMLAEDRLRIGAVSEVELLALLGGAEGPEAMLQALRALGTLPARSGRAPSPAVRTRLHALFTEAGPEAEDQIAEIEAASIRAGAPPLLAGQCLAAAVALWQSFSDSPEPDAMTGLLWRLEALLAPARAGRVREALDLIGAILSDHARLAALSEDVTGELFALLLDGATDIFGGDSVPIEDAQARRFAALFRALVFLDDVEVTQNAAAALGYLDLPALLQIRSADTVDVVLEEISAEKDILIFERFWVGPDGTVHPYDDTRPAIASLALDDRGDEIAQTVGHFLVEHGFARGNIAETKRRGLAAAIIYTADQEEPDPERAEAMRPVISMLREDWRVPVVERDLEAAAADPKGTAAEIARVLHQAAGSRGVNGATGP